MFVGLCNSSQTLPKRLFSTDRYPSEGRVNSYSKPQYLLDILRLLEGTPELKTLQNSPFWSLFRLPLRQCALSGKLVHNFLCRQLVTHNSNELWFTFGGRPLRFSLYEFAKITGLNCGPYPDRELVDGSQTRGQNGSSYWHELVGPNKSATVDDILKMLQVDPRMPAWRKIRLVLIVIVEGVLICGTHPVRPSFTVVEMVKNLDVFYNYPWGREAFERTVRTIKVGKYVPTLSNIICKLKQPSLVLHGFPVSLQLMLFDSIPLLKRYLPSGGQDEFFSDTKIRFMPQLKTYHTQNILQVENDVAVSTMCFYWSLLLLASMSIELSYLLTNICSYVLNKTLGQQGLVVPNGKM